MYVIIFTNSIFFFGPIKVPQGANSIRWNEYCLYSNNTTYFLKKGK